MNIKQAKQEIKNAIEAYLMKDEFGAYRIPAVRQRPVLLMGPPGIGKTQIMEQIARECRIGLVAYTITHHTRQSAVGLPFISEKKYGDHQYSVTEYTMSEIIASVYDKMEETGIKEGILFIDEINCVSETLAPAMLQFLQCKTFGNQRVPEGWIIVAAGNPPEYNKSVRDFDVVTLDRVKRIDVTEDYGVWKEYAYRQGIHPAILNYLDLKKENFYRMETTVDGRLFATARGWEDLSSIMELYEELHKPVDRELVGQYIQHWKISKDFANYLEIYYKYEKDYRIAEILSGRMSDNVPERLKFAAFDERLSVVGLLLGRLGEMFRDWDMWDRYVTELFGFLKEWKEKLDENKKPAAVLKEILQNAENETQRQNKAGQLGARELKVMRRVLEKLRRYAADTDGFLPGEQEEAFAGIKEQFAAEEEARISRIKETKEALTCAFEFLEKAFGDGQEMVAFVAELNTNYYSTRFISENGCDLYQRYNKGLQFDSRQEDILNELDEIESELNEMGTIK